MSFVVVGVILAAWGSLFVMLAGLGRRRPETSPRLPDRPRQPAPRVRAITRGGAWPLRPVIAITVVVCGALGGSLAWSEAAHASSHHVVSHAILRAK